ncbi:uncharacterized protein LOC128983712 isoform X2 [Macrosteles quadrilineatus]|nr:uncharacterized protein LOC128983712 isoform X2 [Macrosteles quadrilineatus]XP_054259094.1 uncharacterized protein LOC128983712 isoform X2 [Macrosteles quadrilineatus]XP_054259095.1 uncharacterized protein LOC128983712 isoform X2 [Macrosteles quadrilineatus]
MLEILKMGCSNRMKMATAFQTYMKLCEVDKLWEIQIFFEKELDLIYFISLVKKQEMIYTPLTVQQQMTPMLMYSVKTILMEKHPNAQINIVLKTPDHSFLTYKFDEGLCPPPTPDSTKEKKALKEKMQYIQSELNKRKPELYEEAKRKQNDNSESDDEVKIEENYDGEEL